MNHYYHFRVRRWVFWAFAGGILFGASVLANLAAKNETVQGELALALVSGAVFWVLFALTCWATDGIEIAPRLPHTRVVPPLPHHEEWEERARLEAIRARAAAETGEAHQVS